MKAYRNTRPTGPNVLKFELERRHHDVLRNGSIILRWISRRWDVGMWTGLGWPRIGTGGEDGSSRSGMWVCGLDWAGPG